MYMHGVNSFAYAEFAARGLHGFRNNIVHVNELPGLIRCYGHTDCFSTYFLFDRGLQEHVRSNDRSVAGYKGPCFAYYLPIDIDSSELKKAQETGKRITSYLVDRCGVHEDSVALYFSGRQ